jgi:hypothetical protein
MTLNEFLLNLSVNILASAIFIFALLYFVRPKIKISPCICYVNEGNLNPENPDKGFFVFKIVNLSLFYADDVRFEISTKEHYQVTGGTNVRYKQIPLKVSSMNYLAKYKPSWWNKDYGAYAVLFGTREDIKEILKNDRNSIELRVTLRHGMTGLSKVFTQTYARPSDIKEGRFHFGNNFNIS